ncbi:MAG: hypothetical protein FJ297_16010 [Planctomycetes bacterium]|nr:hypothetical protein [Planctomycetota bacterium]
MRRREQKPRRVGRSIVVLVDVLNNQVAERPEPECVARRVRRQAIRRINAIAVYVHATFPILIVFVAYRHWSAGQDLTQTLEGVGFVLALFACVLLHEFGHALMAARYGIKTRDITLSPIGGLARLERTPEEPMQELGVALAGPAVNVVIAAGLFAWLMFTASLEPIHALTVTAGPFLTSDLISVPRVIRDHRERTVGEKFQLPPAALLMSCSHTHCGPEFRASRWKADGLSAERRAANDRYAAFLSEKLERVVGDALGRLDSARLSYCHARCGFAMNRRTPSAAGSKNFPNPDGPVDHDVPVLRGDTKRAEPCVSRRSNSNPNHSLPTSRNGSSAWSTRCGIVDPRRVWRTFRALPVAPIGRTQSTPPSFGGKRKKAVNHLDLRPFGVPRFGLEPKTL